MEFLKSTADLLTFQQVSDEFDQKITGGVSVSSIMDMRLEKTTTGGGDSEHLALGTLKNSYVPIGLYLDDRIPKSEVEITYCGGGDYGIIDDAIYDILLDNISLKRTIGPKTLKVKSLYAKQGTRRKQ